MSFESLELNMLVISALVVYSCRNKRDIKEGQPPDDDVHHGNKQHFKMEIRNEVFALSASIIIKTVLSAIKVYEYIYLLAITM